MKTDEQEFVKSKSTIPKNRAVLGSEPFPNSIGLVLERKKLSLLSPKVGAFSKSSAPVL